MSNFVRLVFPHPCRLVWLKPPPWLESGHPFRYSVHLNNCADCRSAVGHDPRDFSAPFGQRLRSRSAPTSTPKLPPTNLAKGRRKTWRLRRNLASSERIRIYGDETWPLAPLRYLRDLLFKSLPNQEPAVATVEEPIPYFADPVAIHPHSRPVIFEKITTYVIPACRLPLINDLHPPQPTLPKLPTRRAAIRHYHGGLHQQG
jgi:hypothetical protein